MELLQFMEYTMNPLLGKKWFRDMSLFLVLTTLQCLLLMASARLPNRRVSRPPIRVRSGRTFVLPMLKTVPRMVVPCRTRENIPPEAMVMAGARFPFRVTAI